MYLHKISESAVPLSDIGMTHLTPPTNTNFQIIFLLT